MAAENSSLDKKELEDCAPEMVENQSPWNIKLLPLGQEISYPQEVKGSTPGLHLSILKPQGCTKKTTDKVGIGLS